MEGIHFSCSKTGTVVESTMTISHVMTDFHEGQIGGISSVLPATKWQLNTYLIYYTECR